MEVGGYQDHSNFALEVHSLADLALAGPAGAYFASTDLAWADLALVDLALVDFALENSALLNLSRALADQHD